METPASITIRVAPQLQDWCGCVAEIPLHAASVRAALALLEHSHPPLYRGVCDETGAVRRHVNLFVNAAHVRERDGLDTLLAPGDEVSILPAVSGG